jgi:hypothetical protein
MEAGTSSQPPPQKDKPTVPRSPRKQPATTIVFLRIPEGVRVKVDLLGYVENIEYSDHDVMDTDKVPKFANQFYLQTVGVNPFGEPVHQPLQWAVGLAKTGILGLLELPHFGRGQYASSCMKQLMAVTHGRDLWLDKLVSIDVDLIAHIIGLPSRGMDPAQFLEEKTKEKALAEEMKKKYGTERGTRGIIIKQISDIATKMAAKIMACKLLKKCRKEEVSAGVVAVAAQCVEGTTFSWAPYLLNLFLEDCKDAQDLGTEIHYSWLIMLIAIMGWQELKYAFFTTRTKPNHGVRYLSLGIASDTRNRKMNATIFEGYLHDLQETIANLWRITPQVVAYYQGIANFKATRHAMWIQAQKDPNKKWLQMHYCITEGDIEMAIKDWEDDWRIPVLTRDIPAGAEEEEARQEHTHDEEAGQE